MTTATRKSIARRIQWAVSALEQGSSAAARDHLKTALRELGPVGRRAVVRDIKLRRAKAAEIQGLPKAFDFTLIDGGSVCMLFANTPQALDWVKIHVAVPDWQNPSAVAIERRYVADILEGIQAAELTIGGAS